MRLIDADEFKLENKRLLHCDFPYLSEVTLEELIDDTPTVDSVHVFRWIGCKERLPNVEEPVMACCRWSSYGNYFIGYLEMDSDNLIWRFEDFEMSGEDFDDVIAWMPLPQPYKMDEVTE